MHSVVDLMREAGPWGLGVVLAAGLGAVTALVGLLLALGGKVPAAVLVGPPVLVLLVGGVGAYLAHDQGVAVMHAAPADQIVPLALAVMAIGDHALLLACLLAWPAAGLSALGALVLARRREEAGLDDALATMLLGALVLACPAGAWWQWAQWEVLDALAHAPADTHPALVAAAKDVWGTRTLVLVVATLLGAAGGALAFVGVSKQAGAALSRRVTPAGLVLGAAVALVAAVALPQRGEANLRTTVAARGVAPPTPGTPPTSTSRARPQDDRPWLVLDGETLRVRGDDRPWEDVLAAAFDLDANLPVNRGGGLRGLIQKDPAALPAPRRAGGPVMLVVDKDATWGTLGPALAALHLGGAGPVSLLCQGPDAVKGLTLKGLPLGEQPCALALFPARRGPPADGEDTVVAATVRGDTVTFSARQGEPVVVPRAAFSQKLVELKRVFPRAFRLRVTAPDDMTVQQLVTLADEARETKDGHELFPVMSLAVFDAAGP